MSSNKSNRLKKAAGLAFTLVMWMAVGAASGVLLMTRLRPEDMPPLRWALLLGGLLLALYFAIFLQIVVHEAGHLVCGLLSGYRFSSFRVLNLTFVRGEDGRVRLRRYSLAGTGGQCLMDPPELRGGRMPVVLYNLGGVIFNLLASALFGAAGLLTRGFLSAALLIAALVGAALALMNGLPFDFGGVANDGCNTRELLREPEATRAFWLQLKTAERLNAGVPLRKLPEEWFAMPEKMDRAITAAVGGLAYERLLDEERYAEAAALACELPQRAPGMLELHRAMLANDRVALALLGYGEAEPPAPTKEQARVLKAMRTHPSVMRTEYISALLERGDSAEAARLREKFERAAARHPSSAELESDWRLMALADTRAEEKEGLGAGKSDNY
ncbi:MAG: hypothetical protein IJU78_02065 [Clostridia bacterium]|nr:hypothetical protein [Clostridia bacterium]